MTTSYTAKAVSVATRPDFEALFGKHKGVRGGCWCTSNRCTSTAYREMGRDGRKAYQRTLVEQGLGHGLLIYAQTGPVAWCQFGPAVDFSQFSRMRRYKKLTIAPEWQPDWRISCLFVDKHHRRVGWSKVALRCALEDIGKRGGGVVEAFPLAIPGAKYASYTGSVSMYLREAFVTVNEIGKHRYLMRRRIDTVSSHITNQSEQP